MKSKLEVMMMTANRGLPLGSKIFMMGGVLSKDPWHGWTGMNSKTI